MGMIVCILLAALELGLAVWTCRKENKKKAWRKNRLIVRVAQLVITAGAMLLSPGQNWRFAPALGILALFVIIAALKMLFGRKKEDGEKKKSSAVAACVLSIVLIGLFLIPAFIFTGYHGLPVTGEYQIGEASAILIDKSRTDPFEQDGSFREVPVHFYYPETQEDSTDRFPLIVFSHGAFGYYQSNTSTYMELASNGYVVVALDHPHHAMFAQDTEGKTVLVDQGFLRDALASNGDSDSEEDEEEMLARIQSWMILRTADMNFALNELESAERDSVLDESWFLTDSGSERILSILNRTDVSKIGLMGHSMGGATSVELGRERKDISAVIDLDGTMLSEYTGIENGEVTVNSEPYTVPVLEFVNWEQYNDLQEYLAEGGVYPNHEVMMHASHGFSTTIRDTKHMDFTDLPLLSPMLGKMLGSGDRDHVETMTTVNSLVLEFFNCYLKGEGAFTVRDSY